MNTVEINARMDALAGQRNEAQNRCVVLSGILAARDAEIAVLKEKLKTETQPPVDPDASRALPFSQEQLAKMDEGQK